MSRLWLDSLSVFSELFINLAAAWFALVFIEPQISRKVDFLILTERLFLAKISLIVTIFLRTKTKNI